MFCRNGESISANCLLDIGNRQTYLSIEVLKPLSSLKSVGLDCNFSLSTLRGDCNKHFKEIVLETDVGFDCPLSLPMFVDKKIDLSVHIKALDSLLLEFQHIKCPFAGRFDRGTNFIPINEIIGLYLIQHLGPLQQGLFHLEKWDDFTHRGTLEVRTMSPLHLILCLNPPPQLNLHTCVLCWSIGAHMRTL